jgi:surface antigen
MRATVIAGLFACVVIVAANGSTVSAEAPDVLLTKNIAAAPLRLDVLANIDAEKKNETVNVSSETEKPQPVVHTVAPEESLSSIAAIHQTTWVRLFNKNEQVAHPDLLVVGQQLTIPQPDEQLPERPLPEPPVVEEPVTGPTTSSLANKPATSTTYRGTSTGNTYTAGYCTWYAKNMRPDLPNNLGNADTWVARAAAQGIPTGSTPRVGAIGQQGMHVVYVQSVNGDGTVTVSEMNFQGLYVVSTRTVPASYFRYIY